MGIDGKVFKWIQSFLTDRFQEVMVNGVKSEPMPVISGVPQGSVIGPLLFLILIGDIDANILDAYIKSFADDTRAMKGVCTSSDVDKLQQVLNKLYKWSSDNNMSLNDKKFEGLRYGLDELLKLMTEYKNPSGKAIEIKKSLKDLGVIMSDDCRFADHINNVLEKARNMCSWILRTFRTREPEPMLLLYKMLVLPILEYCSVLWTPQDVGSIQKLDTIQWSFIRKINCNNASDYWERLKSMKMYSLQRRRERYRIIYTWKILEGLVPNINNKITSKNHARLGRKCDIPSVKNGRLSKIREASLPFNGPQLFNLLPKHIRDLSGVKLTAFKAALDNYLRKVPDEPQLPGYTAYRHASSNSLIHMVHLKQQYLLRLALLFQKQCCYKPVLNNQLTGGREPRKGRKSAEK